ncbi:MAG: VOC family protein [Gammaproteobacteria bacterium]|nr:VOC family protein [Gammaproteobacteria bacterium]
MANVDDIPSIINHVSIGTNQLEAASAFYDKVLATIGAGRKLVIPGLAVAYGKYFPEFWLNSPLNQQAASTGNGTHIAFLARDRATVRAFYDAAIEAGGTSDGEPGLRPEYGPGYFGCFVRDLDGHKIEANIIPEE